MVSSGSARPEPGGNGRHSQHSRQGNPGETGRILVVDDDPTVAEVVARYLVRDGHTVECVADGREALARALANPPDLVVLDLMLPGMGGMEVCARLRSTSPVPIVMLTALGEETDRLVGLETGADDYVTKPFSPRELALRVRSVLRRANGVLSPHSGGLLRDGDLVVDVAAHEVALHGRLLSLTAREFDLLAFLLRHPRQAFTREALLEQVWGWSFGDSSTVTVHVRRLREKIEADPTAPARIVTVWGFGYRYEPVHDPRSEPGPGSGPDHGSGPPAADRPDDSGGRGPRGDGAGDDDQTATEPGSTG